MRRSIFQLPAVLFVVTSLAAQAQTQTAPALSDYLSLTPAQTQALSANNAEYNLAAQSKQGRLAQVQAEIVQETARTIPGVTALGERYVEMETICRELTEAGKSLRNRNLALLSDQQKARLAALEEALRLAPIARAAQFSLLLPPTPPMAPLVVAATSFDVSGALGFFDFPATFPMCRVGGAGRVTGVDGTGLRAAGGAN